jgi:PST family polysaccharide transporter
MPLATFAAVYADDLVALLLGRQWQEAVPLVRIFAIAAFIRPVLGTASTVLITSGQSRRLLVMSTVAQITLVLFILVGVGWGPSGVAFAQLLAPLVLLVPYLHYGFAMTPVTPRVFFRAIRPPCVASAVMAAGLVMLRTAVPGLHPAASVGLGLAVSGALYSGLCFLQSGCRREIRALFNDIEMSIPRVASGSVT